MFISDDGEWLFFKEGVRVSRKLFVKAIRETKPPTEEEVRGAAAKQFVEDMVEFGRRLTGED